MSEWPDNIVKLSDIRQKKLVVLSPYGPVRAGLITSRIIRDLPLTELLNDLERRVNDLTSKSSTVLDTCNTAINRARVALSYSTEREGGISIDEN